MRRFLGVAAVTVALTGSTAASEFDRNILIGTALGAGTGAAIGAAAGGPVGTWIGLAVGSAAGGLVTYLIRPDGCYIRNYRGEGDAAHSLTAEERQNLLFFLRSL